MPEQTMSTAEWCHFEFPSLLPRSDRDICNYAPPDLEDIGKVRSIYFTQVFELEFRCLYFLHENPSDIPIEEGEYLDLRKDIKSYLSRLDESRTTERERIRKQLVYLLYGANCMLGSIDKANRHPKCLLERLHQQS